MNTLLLTPSDVLFFRDGRPMGGSLAGHGAAWPLPNVVNAALYAALHRSEMSGHEHRDVEAGETTDQRERKFGSLVTAGPFPVKQQRWWFPRPADAQCQGNASVTAFPNPAHAGSSSLPRQLRHAVSNALAPSKDNDPERWMDATAWAAYITGAHQGVTAANFGRDADFGAPEHNYGIEIDPNSETVVDGQFYSASYLRLRDNVGLGVLAKTQDKTAGDLINTLFRSDGDETHVVVGGQQRICSVAHLDEQPLPRGLTKGFAEREGKVLVKWVLLSAAIWPEIKGRTAKSGVEINPHPGGWLPNWICAKTGKVLLKVRGERKRRERVTNAREGKGIEATLVSSIVPKPLPVTGWGLGFGRENAGAKSTHLAVPAGAVYYFEAENAAEAAALSKSLNWHGDLTKGNEIINRRSTLMGEKGFGLGVCGTWNPCQQS